MSDEQEECKCEEGAPAWMATFSDLMSLMLTFFVLLLSFSTMDVVKFQGMVHSLKDALGVKRKNPGPFVSMNDTPVQIFQNEKMVEMGNRQTAIGDCAVDQGNQTRRTKKSLKNQKKAKSVARKLASKLSGKQGKKDQYPVVAIEVDERAMRIRLSAPGMFHPGGAVLRPEVLPLLDTIFNEIVVIDGQYRIEGHTDALRPNSKRFKSNWTLSAARATTVVEYAERTRALPRVRLVAAGHADTRPVANNGTAAGREQNRRIEIAVLF